MYLMHRDCDSLSSSLEASAQEPLDSWMSLGGKRPMARSNLSLSNVLDGLKSIFYWKLSSNGVCERTSKTMV
jgi:hypothetical protein